MIHTENIPTKKLYAKGLLPLVLLLSFFALSEYASVQSQLRQFHKTELPFTNDVTKKWRNVPITYLNCLNQNNKTFQDDKIQATINEILLFHNRIFETKVKANANKLLTINHRPRFFQSNSHTLHSVEEYPLYTSIG